MSQGHCVHCFLIDFHCRKLNVFYDLKIISILLTLFMVIMSLMTGNNLFLILANTNMPMRSSLGYSNILHCVQEKTIYL